MTKESNTMKELHEIRLRNYNTTKQMSREDRIRYIKIKAQEAKNIQLLCNKKANKIAHP